MGDDGQTTDDGLNRRSVLRITGGAVAGAAVTGSSKMAAASSSDIVMLDAAALARAIQTRKVSCVYVVRSFETGGVRI